MHVSADRAIAAGLVLTKPAQTLTTVREHLGNNPFEHLLGEERERALLARLARR